MMRSLFAALLAAFAATAAPAQTGPATTAGITSIHRGEPQEIDPVFESRMRVARAEQAWAETREAADELVRLASELGDRLASASAPTPDERKALERVRKLAKRVRSDSGGTGEPEMAERPASRADAARALAERARLLAEELDRSSRFEVNARLIGITGEIILLSDLLRAGR